MTYDQVVQFASTLPEVAEGLSYGNPALKRGTRTMMAPKEGDILAVRIDWDTHDRLLEDHPSLCFKTSHFEGWPWVLVRLPQLQPELMREIVTASWTAAPLKLKLRPKMPL